MFFHCIVYLKVYSKKETDCIEKVFQYGLHSMQ